jgi:holliday junction DNA helicase RuvA
MIGFLRGSVSLLDSSYILLDVSGVGYKVILPPPVLSKLSKDQTLTVFTHTHVREDLLELYGFEDTADLKLFELFIGVSGIGCKTASNIFTLGTRSQIVDAIYKGDVAFFSGVPRLGKKNAQKIIIELKGKLGGTGDIDLGVESPDSSEVMDALKVFGYTSKEAQHALQNIEKDGLSTEEKIRLALRYLGK